MTPDYPPRPGVYHAVHSQVPFIAPIGGDQVCGFSRAVIVHPVSHQTVAH